ncbi:transglutaminase family protein [Sphingomonas panacisoli]|uniref:Transglutaminase family protein n=1 Tax=Sphingomonas panacisoli TaxID=1813879 RepID=A0A5B8LL37_9SPHN|nr:transglutaminase family protein [Sphingomonas panacisoli]QDZ08292.1 transglutaminase family protein [Sphingomonas panacisoli]
MRLSITAFLDYSLPRPADLLIALEVAQTPDQELIEDLLTVGGTGPLTPIAADDGLGRRTWARGAGRVTARYTATVDVERPATLLAGLAADDVKSLPASVVSYLFPSRYCESDRLEEAVLRDYGHLSGGDKIAAMVAWIRAHLTYEPSGKLGTTAIDTMIARRGVCRDYSHLLIAMARAADIPARMVGAYAWALEPEDFHAVVEVWLDGGWRLVDPTGLAPEEGIARIGVGRDATDISFLTIFGRADLIEQRVSVTRLDA